MPTLCFACVLKYKKRQKSKSGLLYNVNHRKLLHHASALATPWLVLRLWARHSKMHATIAAIELKNNNNNNQATSLCATQQHTRQKQ